MAAVIAKLQEIVGIRYQLRRRYRKRPAAVEDVGVVGYVADFAVANGFVPAANGVAWADVGDVGMNEAVVEDAEKHDVALVYCESCEVELDRVGAECAFVLEYAVVDVVFANETNDE